MTNHYLKSCKYAQHKQQEQFGFLDTLSSSLSTATSFWKKKGLTGGLTELAEQANIPMPSINNAVATAGSPIKTGSDGWAEYFWDTAKKVITYVNPSSGQKVTVTPSKGNYKYLSTSPKIRWKDSTPSAMAAQKSKVVDSMPIVPVGQTDDFSFEQEKGFVGKAIDYAKENPLIVGGTAVGVVGIIGGLLLLRRGSGNEHQAQIPQMDELEKMRADIAAQMLMEGVATPRQEPIYQRIDQSDYEPLEQIIIEQQELY